MTELPTKAEAIASLQQLGLSTYEAAVFVALQRLRTGTASDIDRITDVPRSQVYGAADRLAELGVIDVQQSNPIQYRAIELDTARDRLRSRLANEERNAFEFLRSVQGEHATDAETQVDVWTVTGRETIDDRIGVLAEGATDRIVYGAPDPEYVVPVIATALESASSDVSVTVISESQAVCDMFEDTAIETSLIDEELLLLTEGYHGRLLLVDEDTVLLSSFETEGSEAAIWSASTTFGAIFAGLLDDWMEQFLSITEE